MRWAAAIVVGLLLGGVLFLALYTREAAMEREISSSPEEQRGSVLSKVAKKLIAEEQRAWEEEKNRNADYFRRVMLDDFTAAEPDGRRYTKADVLPLIPTVQMTRFALEDFKVMELSKSVAVVTYRAAATALVSGKETETKFLATTVWALRKEKGKEGEVWRMAFHQKTLAP